MSVRRVITPGLTGILIAFAGCAKPEPPNVVATESASETIVAPTPNLNLDAAIKAVLAAVFPQPIDQRVPVESAESKKFEDVKQRLAALGPKAAQLEVLGKPPDHSNDQPRRYRCSFDIRPVPVRAK
jgi:hypothetical protein